MFDWFWNLPPLRAAQSWVDTTRAWDIDPIWAIVIGLGLVFATIALMSRPPAVHERKTAYGHYLGKITPKSIARMLTAPERRKLKTRAEMQAAVERSRARARRKRAKEGEE